MDVRVEEDADDDVFRTLLDGMRLFNRAAIPLLHSRKVTVAVRDARGALRGGAVGRIAGDSMYVEVVWNDDAARGLGLGRRAMLLLEAEAKKCGAVESWLYTMSFQAKPFYEKLGYTEFARLPWLGARHSRHFMRKDL
jgi:GNAT superfamily N-acetyltransferase